MERHKIEAQPVNMTGVREVFDGDADLTAYTPDNLPLRLIVKGRAILSKQLIDSLYVDKRSRDFELLGPVTIRGAEHISGSDRKALILKLQSIDGSAIHAADEEIEFKD